MAKVPLMQIPFKSFPAQNSLFGTTVLFTRNPLLLFKPYQLMISQQYSDPLTVIDYILAQFYGFLIMTKPIQES